MELDSSLSWLALTLTPGVAARLSARLLREFGSPDEVFRASPAQLRACSVPAETAQAVAKKEAFKRAEKDLAYLRKIDGCRLLHWTEHEWQTVDAAGAARCNEATNLALITQLRIASSAELGTRSAERKPKTTQV